MAAVRMARGIVDQGTAEKMGLPRLPEERRNVVHQTSRMKDPTIKNLEHMTIVDSGGADGTTEGADHADAVREPPAQHSAHAHIRHMLHCMFAPCLA